jgi:hypothetical protein
MLKAFLKVIEIRTDRDRRSAAAVGFRALCDNIETNRETRHETSFSHGRIDRSRNGDDRFHRFR